MQSESYRPELAAMIGRASRLTAEEAETMGTAWRSIEGMILTHAMASRWGSISVPQITNGALIEAWNRAVHVDGRAEDLDAARAAGRAVTRCVRHLKISATAKGGSEEAARAAVLAIARRSPLTPDDLRILVAP